MVSGRLLGSGQGPTKTLKLAGLAHRDLSYPEFWSASSEVVTRVEVLVPKCEWVPLQTGEGRGMSFCRALAFMVRNI
jgi:hypothetical protein